MAKWLVVPILLAYLSGYVPEPVSVPILMYHHIDETGAGEMSVSQSCFLEHLDALDAAGFETVSPEDLYNYVYWGTPLPEKPVMITFDDGYESNHTFAYPALQQRGMKAVIFVIGSTVGRDTHPETGASITPHFGYEAAAEMAQSGTISIQSHTYALHSGDPADGRGRRGVMRVEGEPLYAYQKLLREDFTKSISEIQQETNRRVLALAYPFGISTEESERMCDELHIPITITTNTGFAQIQTGVPSSLRRLNRFSVDDCSPETLLSWITNP